MIKIGQKEKNKGVKKALIFFALKDGSIKRTEFCFVEIAIFWCCFECNEVLTYVVF